MSLSERMQELEQKLAAINAAEVEEQDHLRMAAEIHARNAEASAEAAAEYDAIMGAFKTRYAELTGSGATAPAPAPAPPPPPPPPAADAAATDQAASVPTGIDGGAPDPAAKPPA